MRTDDNQQRRWKRELEKEFSSPDLILGLEQDAKEIHFDIWKEPKEPLEFGRTMKLPKIEPLVNTASGTDPQVQVSKGPITSPGLPTLNGGNMEGEAGRIAQVGFRDFGSQDPRQAIYDIRRPPGAHPIDLLAYIVSLHSRKYGRTPAYIYVPRGLLPAVLEDLKIRYKGRFQDEMPSIDEQGERVLVRIAADDRLQAHEIRCRERSAWT